MSPRTLALLGAVLAALHSSTPARGAPPGRIDVRLGMVSYEESAGQVRDYQELFDKLSESGKVPIRARIAPGTYAEVLNWLDRGLIDVAVLTPALYAETLKQPAPGARRVHAECRYFATEGAPPAEGRDPYRYRAACLVRRGSPLRRFDDLKKAAGEKRVRFLLVDRLSASGHLAQRHALLRGASLALGDDQVEYTYSHTAALERLAKGREGGKELVAFVSADVTPPKNLGAEFEPVSDFPGLGTEEYAIPQNVWVARPGFEHFAHLRRLLCRHTDKRGRQYDCEREAVDKPLYQRVASWTDDLRAAADAPASLDEIGWLLRHYKSEHPAEGPRLALVLSGGGAKCSYQAGALSVIENKLGGDVGLVVGTSGGALNAVPVALGVTKDDPDRLGNTWLGLDLPELARPSWLVCALLGLWVACLVVLLLGALRRAVLGCVPPSRHLLWAVPLLLASASVLLALFLLPWVSAEWIDRRPALRYPQILLAFGFGKLVTTLPALLWAGAMYPAAGRLTAAGAWFRRHPALTRSALATVVLGLPAVILAAQLVLVETLFEGAGMKRTFARHYSELTREAGAGPDTSPGEDDEQRLRALSRTIVRRIGAADNPLKRDLVITGSCLPPRPGGLDSDLYFYLPAGRGRPAPSFGSRGVALAEHPDILMGVVMGSGTIYPGFPSSTIQDFPRGGESVDLIDGGFAHNSPVEAAVQWGATHILLIEASPKSEKEQDKEHEAGAVPAARHSLLHNAGDTFNHLYDQAQLLDARSREKVAIFTLRPKKWHLTVIDFSRGLMSDAIAAGKADAAGANFQRQHGEPRFLEAAEPAHPSP